MNGGMIIMLRTWKSFSFFMTYDSFFALLIKINKRRLFGKSFNLIKGPRKLSKIYTFAYARNSIVVLLFVRLVGSSSL